MTMDSEELLMLHAFWAGGIFSYTCHDVETQLSKPYIVMELSKCYIVMELYKCYIVN